jgi:hypothetical protein
LRRRAGLVAAVCAAAALIVPASAAAAVPRDFYGVVTQGALGPDDARMMSEAGVGTLRFHLDWRNYQGQPGRCQAAAEVGICDWRNLDYAIGLFASAGIRAFPFLLNVPWFVDEDSNTPPIRSAADRTAWSRFVSSLVARYGQGGEYWRRYFEVQFPGAKPVPITHWEIWNEPSDGSYWQPRPNPREYARLLELTGRAIHRANQRANVVSAGLFGTPDPRNDGIKAFRYYPKLFGYPGIHRHFDSIGVHPYGPTLKRVKVQMGWLLDAMEEFDLSDRDVWVTEIAWSSSQPPTDLGVGPEGQAANLNSSFALLRRQRRDWNLAGLHWYAWQDLAGPGLCEFCPEAGLVTHDRQPKPSYFAFAENAG